MHGAMCIIAKSFLTGYSIRVRACGRVQKGLWLNSHAALCAEIFGIPRGVARRAAYVR